MSDSTKKKPAVFGIPAPWSGDPGSGTGTRAHPHLYAIWWQVYRAARVVRHALGLHDWELWGLWDEGWQTKRCDWCGQYKTEPEP